MPPYINEKFVFSIHGIEYTVGFWLSYTFMMIGTFISFILFFFINLLTNPVIFVLFVMQYNDNSGNPFSDVFWLAALVQSIGELEFGQQVSRNSLNWFPCVFVLIS